MILVDHREPCKERGGKIDMVESLTALGYEAKRTHLEVGDYQFHDKDQGLILVTRKASDLMESVFSGHFQDELNRCIETIHTYGSGKLFWLLEGVWASGSFDQKHHFGTAYFVRSGPAWFRKAAERNTNPKALIGMQVSAQTAGIYYITTGSKYETALALGVLYDRAQLGWPTRLAHGIKRTELRWSDDTHVQRLMALWPRLNEQTAVEILGRFGTIKAALNASPAELLSISGVGKTLVKNLQEVLN